VGTALLPGDVASRPVYVRVSTVIRRDAVESACGLIRQPVVASLRP
jgi:hypothetical protein